MPRAARPRPTRDARHTYVTHEGALHRLKFWSDAEWEDLPAACRPFLAERVAELGCWIGAVPVENLN